MHSYPGSGLGRSCREIKRFQISARRGNEQARNRPAVARSDDLPRNAPRLIAKRQAAGVIGP
jgi:hypothetical protein